MAYSAMPAKVGGDTITLANYDNIRDNFAAGVPDIYTAKGDLAAGTAADTATRVAVGADDSTLVADSAQANGLRWQIQPAARVYNDDDIEIDADTWTTVTFNQERYDTDGCHSTLAQTGRLTVPANGDGIYHIGGNVEIKMPGLEGANSTGMEIRLNGADPIAKAFGQYERAVNPWIVVSCDYALVAADYVELRCYSLNGYDINCSPNCSPEFWFHWVRPL